MRVLRMALAGLMLVALGTAAQAAHIFNWVDGNVDTKGTAFETTAPGNIPAGWTLSGTNAPLVSNELSHEGDQSVKVSAAGGMFRPETFHATGEYNFMYYDDLGGLIEAPNKTVRVGLYRSGETTSSRFGALAVETGVSRTHYTAHWAFSFAATTIPRSEGWRHMTIAWFPSSFAGDPTTRVQFYVDGVLGHQIEHAGSVIPAGEWMGAPFGTGTPVWVDTMVPEPASLALLGLGLMGLGFAGRRRR